MPTNPQREATERLERTIDFDRRFPENVFRGEWREMLFFSSDRVFDREFANLATELLLIEGASSICMCGLHQATLDSGERSSFYFLDERTTSELYISFLKKEWLYLMGRFGLISNVGCWCIYVEKAMEFAVLAIRDQALLETARSIINNLGALPIAQAIENPPSYGLTARGLTQEWRQRLLVVYGTH